MKQKINRIRRRSGIVGILFLLMMLMFFWIGYPEKSILTAFDNEEAGEFTGNVYVSCGDNEKTMVLPGNIPAKAGDTITIQGTLAEDSVSVCFRYLLQHLS